MLDTGFKYHYITSMNKKLCIHCNNKIIGRGKKYCSYKCQQNFQRMEKVKQWINGEHSGMRGKTSTSKWIKWYLISIYGEKCQQCGWSEQNITTCKIPIELDHIDGDFTNNDKNNLRLLCPNCHSLTPSYKGGNKKKGRPRSKYYRGM